MPSSNHGRYEQLVEEAIAEQRAAPVDILGIGDADGEIRYLTDHRRSFTRTLQDIDGLLATKGQRVLEIGSFLGAVSIPLKKLGYDVFALDIPEFQRSEKLGELYRRHSIPFVGANLRRYSLPYADATFDAVVACEILEHFNFNPLPLVQEINRVLRPGGYFYVGMPNQASLFNRLRLLSGRSILEPISSYFAQLDRNDNMIVGLHWREYAMAETTEMLKRMGFDIARAYYFAEGSRTSNHARRALRTLAYKLVPSLSPSQVVIGRKLEDKRYEFWLTDANT